MQPCNREILRVWTSPFASLARPCCNTGQKANYRVVHATGREPSVEESVTLCTHKNGELEDCTKYACALHSCLRYM